MVIFGLIFFWNIITPQGPRLCRRDLHHNDLFPTTTTMVLIIMVWVSIGKIFWLIAPLDPTLEGSLHWSIWRGAYGGYSCIGLVTFNFSGGGRDSARSRTKQTPIKVLHNISWPHLPRGGWGTKFFFYIFSNTTKSGFEGMVLKAIMHSIQIWAQCFIQFFFFKI